MGVTPPSPAKITSPSGGPALACGLARKSTRWTSSARWRPRGQTDGSAAAPVVAADGSAFEVVSRSRLALAIGYGFTNALSEKGHVDAWPWHEQLGPYTDLYTFHRYFKRGGPAPVGAQNWGPHGGGDPGFRLFPPALSVAENAFAQAENLPNNQVPRKIEPVVHPATVDCIARERVELPRHDFHEGYLEKQGEANMIGYGGNWRGRYFRIVHPNTLEYFKNQAAWLLASAHEEENGKRKGSWDISDRARIVDNPLSVREFTINGRHLRIPLSVPDAEAIIKKGEWLAALRASDETVGDIVHALREQLRLARENSPTASFAITPAKPGDGWREPRGRFIMSPLWLQDFYFYPDVQSVDVVKLEPIRKYSSFLLDKDHVRFAQHRTSRAFAPAEGSHRTAGEVRGLPSEQHADHQLGNLHGGCASRPNPHRPCYSHRRDLQG
jgi:hypothetical protein